MELLDTAILPVSLLLGVVLAFVTIRNNEKFPEKLFGGFIACVVVLCYGLAVVFHGRG